jgi:hypothetical protein
MRHQKQ